MNILTRQEVEAVVERFDPHANKCDYCKYDGKVTPFCEYCGCEYPRGVTIGNVLEKIREKEGYVFTHKIYSDLLIYWQPLGLSRSLQQIIESSRWVEVECIDSECPCGVFPLRNNNCPYKSRLTSPEANALFSFLLQIGL